MESEEFHKIKRVSLQEHHHFSDSRYCVLTDSGTSSLSASAVVALEIWAYRGSQSCYLFHIAGSGSGTDTFHSSTEEAVAIAEDQYGVRPDEWSNVG